ncbi:hypothetical protein LCGC14_2986530 [marine sediment metagenome]|uniref:Uncharacterized protein n=1 Tax=marine sediment metagenome TaxID=412755 RepID=A0A0F8ZW82_9ZZZZ
MAEFDRNKLKEIFKEGINVGKTSGERYLNVVVYEYDGGSKKIRIQPANKNTNKNCDSNKKWLNAHSITGITKDEAKGLIKLLEKALVKL